VLRRKNLNNINTQIYKDVKYRPSVLKTAGIRVSVPLVTVLLLLMQSANLQTFLENTYLNVYPSSSSSSSSSIPVAQT
jgi:hypothetical protein